MSKKSLKGHLFLKRALIPKYSLDNTVTETLFMAVYMSVFLENFLIFIFKVSTLVKIAMFARVMV